MERQRYSIQTPGPTSRVNFVGSNPGKIVVQYSDGTQQVYRDIDGVEGNKYRDILCAHFPSWRAHYRELEEAEAKRAKAASEPTGQTNPGSQRGEDYRRPGSQKKAAGNQPQAAKKPRVNRYLSGDSV